MCSTLAFLNLPAAIEALEQPIGLPPTLLQHSEEVRQQGGAHSLQDTFATINAMAEKDNAILDEVTLFHLNSATFELDFSLHMQAIRTLDDEAKDDEEMRNQFGAKWTRTRSNDITANLRETAKVYRNKMATAKKSDQLINRKLEQHLHYIESLSLTKVQSFMDHTTWAMTIVC